MGLTDVFTRLFSRSPATSATSRNNDTPVEHVIRWDPSGKAATVTKTTTNPAKHQDPFGDLVDDDEILNMDDQHNDNNTNASTSSSTSQAPSITEPKPAHHQHAGYPSQHAPFTNTPLSPHSPSSSPSSANSSIAPIDLGPAPRNKQELLNELRRNYAEVVSLVRKVDNHLDHQDRRSERMLEIAEKLPKAIEQIERLEDRHAELLSAVTRLTETLKEGQENNQTGVNKQIHALEQLHTTIDQSNEQSRELSARVAGELNDFRSAVGQMVGSTQQLSTAIDTINTREDTREQQLRKTLEQTRKWTIGLVVFLAIAGLCAIAAVVIALLQK